MRKSSLPYLCKHCGTEDPDRFQKGRKGICEVCRQPSKAGTPSKRDAKILKTVTDHPNGITSKQIAELIGTPRKEVSRRMYWLKKDGCVGASDHHTQSVPVWVIPKTCEKRIAPDGAVAVSIGPSWYKVSRGMVWRWSEGQWLSVRSESRTVEDVSAAIRASYVFKLKGLSDPMFN